MKNILSSLIPAAILFVLTLVGGLLLVRAQLGNSRDNPVVRQAMSARPPLPNAPNSKALATASKDTAPSRAVGR